jgi:2-dehydro-3-deoxyphosphogluconate aldolase/(4S)-4-hydroxy-2-oxoglutarate aldolase
MVAALSAPFRGVRFIPTGGIDEDNAAGYLALPSVLAVGGTWISSPALVAAGDWTEVRRLAAQAVAIARRREER